MTIKRISGFENKTVSLAVEDTRSSEFTRKPLKAHTLPRSFLTCPRHQAHRPQWGFSCLQAGSFSSWLLLHLCLNHRSLISAMGRDWFVGAFAKQSSVTIPWFPASWPDRLVSRSSLEETTQISHSGKNELSSATRLWSLTVRLENITIFFTLCLPK